MKTAKKKKHGQADELVTLTGSSFRKRVNPFSAAAVKLALLYMLSLGIVMSVVDIYEIPYDALQAAVQILLIVTAMFCLLVFLRKRIVLPVMAVGSGLLYFLLSDKINSSLQLFRDFIYIKLDSRLLYTLQYVPSDSYAYFTRTQDFISGMNTAMLILSMIISLVCVLCCYKKFRPIGIIVMCSVLFAPAFIAERADYTPFLLLMLGAFFGFCAVSSSNEIFSYDLSLPNARKCEAVPQGKKQPARKTSLQRVISDLSYYGKNGICGIIAATIALSSAFALQSQFEKHEYIDTDEIIEAVTDFANDVSDFFGSMFSSSEAPEFNGYFSSDNFRMSNDIQLNAPPSSQGEAVLNVASDTSDGVYLVGDLGVSFTGTSWESISKKVGKNEIIPKEYGIDDSFYPDEIFSKYHYYGYYSASIDDFVYTSDWGKDLEYCAEMLPDELEELPAYYLPSSYFYPLFNNSTVTVDYLKNTDIVFKPFMPDNSAYYNNEKFNVYGDTVLRIADKNDWMKSFSSGVIAPESSLDFMKLENGNNRDYSHLFGAEYKSFVQNKEKYDRFVYDTYMSVPESERDNINRFLDEFESSGKSVKAGEIESDYLYAYAMCQYLKNNYTYSLYVDNTANKEHTLLGNFLFDTRQGHCALYASVMTLALREEGIPARYVTGFSSGQLKWNREIGRYEKTLYENDLHAWVEVYFENIGWLPFDPTGYGSNGDTPIHMDGSQSGNSSQTTPPASETVTTPPETTTTATTATQGGATDSQTTAPGTQTPSSSTDKTDKPGENSFDITPLLYAAAGIASVGFVVIVAVLVVDSVKKKNIRRFKKFRKDDPTRAVKNMKSFILAVFKVTDITPQSTELPSEFAARADKATESLGMPCKLSDVMEIIEKAEFSADGVNEHERFAVYEYTDSLYKLVLKRAGKIKRIILKIIL